MTREEVCSICEISKKYIEQKNHKPFGISLSFPGIVDRETNIIKSLPHIGWKDIDVESEDIDIATEKIVKKFEKILVKIYG